MNTVFKTYRLKNHYWWVALLVFLASCGNKRLSKKEIHQKRLGEIYDRLKQEYIRGNRDLDKAMNLGFNAMLQYLDRYCLFIPKEEKEKYLDYYLKRMTGIGVTISPQNKKNNTGMRVIRIKEDGPAREAGVQPGDYIIEINGTKVERKKFSYICDDLLKGEDTTTPLTLKVKRYNGKIETLTFTRKLISTPSIAFSGLLDGNVGYLRLSSFTSGCAKEVKEAYQKLKDAGAQSFVLDLEKNGGGNLEELIKVCNLFVGKGQLILTERGRNKKILKKWYTKEKATFPDISLAVIIGKRSASASELCSAFLQDLDRAVIIGSSNSYGKGLVQTTRPTSDGSLLKITTSRYATPSGRFIYHDNERFKKVRRIREDQKPLEDYQYDETSSEILDPTDQEVLEGENILDDESKKEKIESGRTTTHGRPIYKGEGITPDIKTSTKEECDLVDTLIREEVLLDYAITFTQQYSKAKSIKDFKLTQHQYEKFVDFASAKKYETQAEKALKELWKAIETDAYHQTFKEDFKTLQKNLATRNRKENLRNFQNLIQPALEKEIIQIWYFRKGAEKYDIIHNPNQKKATEILSNQSEYNRILAPPVN